MFKDRLKSILGASAVRPAGSGAAAAPKGPAVTRPSSGLDQFFGAIRDRAGLTLVDFGGASQANISFITNLGHRLSSEDFLKALEVAFADGDFYGNQADEEKVEIFKRENLDFPEGNFDGALVWDSLQFLSPPLLEDTVTQLHRLLRPGSFLLAFFSSDEKSDLVPTYHYRIADQKTLTLVPRGSRKRAQYFNNRSLEKMFSNFATVKFFLTRDNLREVLVKR